MVKRLYCCLLLSLLLCGCGAEPTLETVEDIIPVEAAAIPQQIYIPMPEEASSPTFQDDTGMEVYLCRGYTVAKQILPSGDLEKTVMQICGQSKENLAIMERMQEEAKRYDFCWTSAGEEGLQLGRACILDDENYHYVVSAMATETEAGNLRDTWDDMFASCRLLRPELDLSTGS